MRLKTAHKRKARRVPRKRTEPSDIAEYVGWTLEGSPLTMKEAEGRPSLKPALTQLTILTASTWAVPLWAID